MNICPACVSKRKMYWLLAKQIINVPKVECRCVEDGVEEVLLKCKKELQNIGFYSRHMVGYEKGLAIVEVHVILLEEDTEAIGRFKLKNLHKHYRKM